jgi:hypothetical protein
MGMGLFKRRERTSIAELDGRTLDALRRAGADLSQPRHVLHFLYFPNREDAVAAADVLRAEGWTVVVDAAAVGSNWLARAEGTRVVSAESCARDRERFTALTSASGGEYDGWEASASP